MSVLKKINDFMEKIAAVGLIFFMAVIAITIPITVFSRYVLQNTPIWTDETALFALVWASMLGAAVGLRRGYQVGIRTVVEKAPKAVAVPLESLGLLFMAVFFGTMVFFGAKQTTINMHQRSAAMQIPMGLPYLALPVGFFVMLAFTVEEIGKLARRIAGKKEEV